MIRIREPLFTWHSCREKYSVLVEFLQFLVMLVMFVGPAFQRRFIGRIPKGPDGDSRPAAPVTNGLAGAMVHLCRSRGELLLENALLRQQLIVLRRQVSRPQLRNSDCFLMALLASRLRTWKSAL